MKEPINTAEMINKTKKVSFISSIPYKAGKKFDKKQKR